MPVDAIPVPLTEDYREPTALDPSAGQRLVNVRSWRQGLEKFGGLTKLGNVGDLEDVPRTFFEGVFLDGTRRLIAISGDNFQTWDGTSWAANISGVAGRATVPTASNVRYSMVNTLGEVYIAAGGNNNILIYDQNLGAPLDLVTLVHGVVGVTNLTCRVILGFADRLVLVRCFEDGVDTQTLIRWNSTDQGPVGGFNEALVGADVADVGETSSEPLTGGFVIGERAFLTKAHEILELIPTGNAAPAFAIQSRISGTGLISPYSVAVVQNIAFFIGSDNVYMFDGNQITPIGDPILDALTPLFESRGNDQLRPMAAIYPRREEYWLLPGLTNDTAYIFDYRRQRWYESDLTVPGASPPNHGPSAFGTVSAALYSGALETETLVQNGSTASTTTVFMLDESVTDRVDYGASNLATADQIACSVRTKQLFPKRKGFRGVVEPAATDKVNILFEVSFKGAASTSVTVTATDAGGDTASQTVTTDAGGRGKAFFTFPWQCVDFTFANTGTGDFALVGVITYRWGEGGWHLPTDPH